MSSAHKYSILFITLDSCRYDTFLRADAPNLKAIGPLYKAMAPGNFTYSSHSAMFVGFTPGLASEKQAFLNPKFAKIFRMDNGGHPGRQSPHFALSGHNIIEGFKRKGYLTIGTGAVGWFNPQTETGQNLTRDFNSFYFAENSYSLAKQLQWLQMQLAETNEPVFSFLNIGETHVPYFYQGAPWDAAFNPCVPFADTNDANECSMRQKACLEHVDKLIAPLLTYFADSSILICADHGDCWGEDGLWEHGIHHDKVLEVPLLFNLIDPGK